MMDFWQFQIGKNSILASSKQAKKPILVIIASKKVWKSEMMIFLQFQKGKTLL